MTRSRSLSLVAVLVAALVATACVYSEGKKAEVRGDTKLDPPATAAVLSSITTDDLMRRVATLSSDAFEGRSPASVGEEKTVDYLVSEFERIGVAPGNPNGTYVQEVPLIGFTAETEARFSVGGRELDVTLPDDCLALSKRMVPEVRVDASELVFVGYGVVAPEYRWDDYKGQDLTGKTLLMLVNDPAIPDPEDPTQLDPAMFRGRAMTYYGRWTYKYEIATEKGAAAVLVIHEEGPAGYPYGVVSGSWGRENFDIDTPDKNVGRVPVEGWISRPFATRLFEAAGMDFEGAKEAALAPDFEPVALGGEATFHIRNTMRDVRSRNVLARIDGSDPEVADEVVVFTAHWDHLGIDPALEGDQIYNGALDNGTGVASVLELAEAFQMLETAPRRSLVFMLVTAEEKGLLGSKYYAANPLTPLTKTLANINMDGMNQWGRTRDIGVVGYGNSTLDDLLIAAAVQQGRSVTPNKHTEKGYYYRSDHFNFAKRGVPALYVKPGSDFIGQPADFGERKAAEYVQADYHQVSDEIKPDWDLSGMVDDLWLLFRVGLNVANGRRWPEWKPGTEFKAVREQMLSVENPG